MIPSGEHARIIARVLSAEQSHKHEEKPAEQAARLAVMLPAPRRFEKNPYSSYLNYRTQLVLGRMQYAEVP